MKIFSEAPFCYVVIALFWSFYQGYRGAVEHKLFYNQKTYVEATKEWRDSRSPDWTCCQQFIVLYLHDFVFRFVCTMAGFVSLYFAYYLLNTFEVKDLVQLSAGSSALIASAFIVGVIGVGGQLHHVILLGKKI